MKRIITAMAFLVFAGAVGMMAGWHRLATAGVPAGAEQVVHMTAKRFEYTPSQITLKKGCPSSWKLPRWIGTTASRCPSSVSART